MAPEQVFKKPEESGRGRFFRAAGVIGVATVASRILGLAREIAFAGIFAMGYINAKNATAKK